LRSKGFAARNGLFARRGRVWHDAVLASLALNGDAFMMPVQKRPIHQKRVLPLTRRSRPAISKLYPIF
jgi:hypothetical protein